MNKNLHGLHLRRAEDLLVRSAGVYGAVLRRSSRPLTPASPSSQWKMETKRRFFPVLRSMVEKSELCHGQEREWPKSPLVWPDTIPEPRNEPSAIRELSIDRSPLKHSQLEGGVPEIT